MAYLGQSLTEGTRRVYTYTATASQTTFSAVYGVGAVDVYQNGVLLAPTDYTATNGTTVALTVGAAVNDEITIICHNTFSVADTVSASQGGTFNAGIDVTGTVTADGLTVSSSGTANSLTLTKTDGNATKLVAGNTEGTHTFEFNNGGMFLLDTTGLRLGLNSGGDISFYEDTGTTAKFFWDASAESLGIGTNSPSTPLHISKAGNGIVTVERSNKTSGSGYLGFNVEGNSQATIAFDDGGGLSIGRSVDPSIQSGYTNDFVINSNGYVGIGTFTPGRILDINGAGSGNVVGIKGGANNQVNIAHGSNSSWGLLLGNSDSSVNIGYHYSTSGANLSTAVINVNNDALHLGTNNNQVMTINHSGNVSIGVNTTSYGKLDVYREPASGWTRSVTRNAGRAAFTGVYKTTSPSTTNSAGIFAHNATLSAWDDLWINAHDNGSGGVAGATSQNIYMAGKVHKPQQPFFHASFPTAINITSNTQLIAFSTAVSNIGGNYNTSNYRFTCPVAGRYFFSVGIRYNYPPNTSSYTRFTLRKNGSQTAAQMSILDPINTFSASSYQSASQVVILDCAANDYFDVVEYSNTTGGQIAGTECHFIGYLLG